MITSVTCGTFYIWAILFVKELNRIAAIMTSSKYSANNGMYLPISDAAAGRRFWHAYGSIWQCRPSLSNRHERRRNRITIRSHMKTILIKLAGIFALTSVLLVPQLAAIALDTSSGSY